MLSSHYVRNLGANQQFGILEVEYVRDVHREFSASFGKPNGMEMPLDEIAVRKLQGGWPDNAANHGDRPLEVILVMRPLRRAIGDYQRRLA